LVSRPRPSAAARVSLVIAYFAATLTPYPISGVLPVMLGVVIPRVLVIILIYADRGMSWWLLIHGLAMGIVCIAAGEERS
jgi:hypothetical protein